MVCDGTEDCPEGEDESSCEHFLCAGLLRCRLDDICVHPMDICDGILHCLLSGDDESLCDLLPCPTGCVCRGTAVMCNSLTDVHTLSKQTTAVILHSIQMPSSHSFRHLHNMVHLKLSNCTFFDNTINKDMFYDLIYMLYLMLSRNNIEMINRKAFADMRLLIYIDLQHNNIFTIQSNTFNNLESIHHFNLSHINLIEIHENAFIGLENLQYLNLSNNRITMIKALTFSGLYTIIHIDLRHNSISYIEQATFNIDKISFTVYFDKNYYCCYLGINHYCHADNIMTYNKTHCSKLFEDHRYIVVIAMFSLLSIVVIVFLQWHLRSIKRSPIYILLLRYSLFADLLPPIYLLVLVIISIPNNSNYIFLNTVWIEGSSCFILSVFITVGVVMSKIMTFLVSLIQLIAVKFIFKKHLNTAHFQIYLIIIWIIVTTLVSVKELHFPLNNRYCFPFIANNGIYTIDAVLLIATYAAMFLVIVGVAFVNRSVLRHVKQSNVLVKSSKTASNERLLLKNAGLLVTTEILLWLLLVTIPIYSYVSPQMVHHYILLISIAIYTNVIIHTTLFVMKVLS